MIYTELTKKALKLSFKVHQNKLDAGGSPYVYHPFYVAMQMTDELSVCVALLHDVVEDTQNSKNPITIKKLKKKGFPDEVVEAVDFLTHKKGVKYLDYVKNIKKNKIATLVKKADLKHNSDLARVLKSKDAPVDKKTAKRLDKYKLALAILQKKKPPVLAPSKKEEKGTKKNKKVEGKKATPKQEEKAKK